MGGPCTVDGQSRSELDNFYHCAIRAEGEVWCSSEQYFQACKFPGNEAARQAVRRTAGAMDCWQAGQSYKLRADWEQEKVDAMYRANFAKFSQNPGLRFMLVSSTSGIEPMGGLFWKTWNMVLLERIREELRPAEGRDGKVLRLCAELMGRYRQAAASGDEHLVEVVTTWASRRSLPPEVQPGGVAAVRVAGVDTDVNGWLDDGVFRLDSLAPEVNGKPHFRSSAGGHLYYGIKHGVGAWVLDEDLCPREATGCAYLLKRDLGSEGLPLGSHTWSVFQETGHKNAIVVVQAA